MDLKLFEAMDDNDYNGIEDNQDECEEMPPQIFPEHDAQTDRFTRTLYYGKLPKSDRPSLPFTQLAVDQFTNAGLDALGEKLGRLDMVRAADITRNACAGPNSLVLALLYLDKLRKRNPDYLNTVSSADLFLVSLMVASKFLHDDGEEDEVFNDEWASSGGIDTKELNKLELKFLSALDWRIYIDNQEFQTAVKSVETDIAFKEVSRRGWASYTDLDVLSQSMEIQAMWSTFIAYTLKMTAVCVTAYAAGIISLLGTAAVLNKTPVGPTGVSSSIRTLTDSLSSALDNQDTLAQVPDFDDFANETAHAHVTPADLLAASLLVASLSAGVSPLTERDLEDYIDLKESSEKINEAANVNTNQTQAAWLAEYSKHEERTFTNWNRPALDEDNIAHNHLWVHGQSGYVFHQSVDHLVSERGTTTNPGLSDNLGLVVDRWSRLMMEDQHRLDSISSYLGRCPVLKWGSSLTRTGWLDPVSWIQMKG